MDTSFKKDSTDGMDVEEASGSAPSAQADENRDSSVAATTASDPAASQLPTQAMSTAPTGPPIETLIKAFQAKDSIMDVNILSYLKTFISAGGKPQVNLLLVFIPSWFARDTFIFSFADVCFL